MNKYTCADTYAYTCKPATGRPSDLKSTGYSLCCGPQILRLWFGVLDCGFMGFVRLSFMCLGLMARWDCVCLCALV